MGIIKKLNWSNIFIFLFLVIFPFGQSFHLTFNLLGVGTIAQPLDIVVGMAAVYSIIAKYKKPAIFKYINNFLIFALFSFFLSVFIFKSPIVVYGFLYLIRLSAYVYFLIYVWNFVRADKGNSKLLVDSLLIISVVSAVFGWFQFFAVPSIKSLFVLGWDEHMFRLVGTFLDPAFLGLIIVFGLIITIYRYIEVRGWPNLVISFFLLVSLAFTYSRASYLAFLAGVITVGILKKKLKYILYLIGVLIVLVIFLPTARNNSIRFFRSFSVINRLDNYRQTLQIIKKYPVFGVGYNNLCLARNEVVGPESYFSHSCSGSDSSLLFVLVTTGVVGFIIFVHGMMRVAANVKRGPYLAILSSSFLAALTASFFSNALFYPWIMGYLVILLAVSLTD